jgi:hypothetical protein
MREARKRQLQCWQEKGDNRKIAATRSLAESGLARSTCSWRHWGQFSERPIELFSQNLSPER